MSTAKVRFGGRMVRLTPSPRTVDTITVGAAPLAQITIYEQLVLLTRRDGPRWRQYPIDATALAAELGRVPIASGLLPPHTLGTGVIKGAPFLATYVPPRIATLQLETGRYSIPLPPLVWAGCGSDYRIWALGMLDYPTRGDVPLMVAPFPNCYKNGSICWGTSDARPVVSAATLARVLDLFLSESYFNLHLANGKSVAFPASVVAQWAQLVADGALEYPLDDLMPAECHLSWLLSGGPWQGGAR